VLPVNPAERKRKGEIQLSQAAEGKRYAVISLQERDPKLLEFLHAAGIGPGKRLRVVSQNYDQTVLIELPTGKSILGRPAAEAVWLKLEKQGTEPREPRGPEEQIKRR
jgi:DtxR family Mn-dependent transcriptional regulator